jgi:hypothetical protein
MDEIAKLQRALWAAHKAFERISFCDKRPSRGSGGMSLEVQERNAVYRDVPASAFYDAQQAVEELLDVNYKPKETNNG